MATKTYMPAVKRRIIVRPNPVYGIINYDIDNAYPQRVLELVRQSPTAKKCWKKKTNFIEGNGFEEPGISEVVINEKKNLTIGKLLKAVAKDKALFTGFGIQVNYNANYKIASVNYVKYEDIRQGDTDSPRYIGKYVIYKDWGRKTWRSIYTAKFDVLDAYNPDPVVIKAQVIEAGGWDKYKGQLFYLTPMVDDYELAEFDAALEDVETEAGIKVFNNRQIKTGFMPSSIIFMEARREEADNEGPVDDGMLGITNRPSLLEDNLASFQGADEAQKILVIEVDDLDKKPVVEKYDIQNNDKLFETTAKSVEANIIKGFDIPKELVSSESKNGLSNGGEKIAAIQEFNDTTSPDRLEISKVFNDIFINFYIPVNPSGNWNITELTTDGAGPDIIKYADKVQLVIESTKMKRENKVAYLVNLYGFKVKEAEAMIPDDDFVKEASQADVKAPIKTSDPKIQEVDNG